MISNLSLVTHHLSLVTVHILMEREGEFKRGNKNEYEWYLKKI